MGEVGAEREDGRVRVCPQCGTPASEAPFCSECGFELASAREIPTRTEWEQQQRPTELAELAERAIPPYKAGASESAVAERKRNRTIAVVSAAVVAAVIAVILVIVIGGASGDFGCREDMEGSSASYLLSEDEMNTLVDTCVELRKACEEEGGTNCENL